MTRTAALIIECVALVVYTALVYGLGKRMGRALEQRQSGTLHRWSPIPHVLSGPALIGAIMVVTVFLWNTAR